MPTVPASCTPAQNAERRNAGLFAHELSQLGSRYSDRVRQAPGEPHAVAQPFGNAFGSAVAVPRVGQPRVATYENGNSIVARARCFDAIRDHRVR